MMLRIIWQGVILILLFAYIIEFAFFGVHSISSNFFDIFQETLIVEIIPFVIIILYLNKRIKLYLRNKFLITVFITMAVINFIFTSSIIQQLFNKLAFKMNEAIDFVNIPLTEFFYYIKTIMYMPYYNHIGIYFALLAVINNNRKEVKNNEKLVIEERKTKGLYTNKKIIFAGIFFGIMPLIVKIIMNEF